MKINNKPWLKFYDEGVPHTIDYPDETLPQILERAAESFANNSAIIYGGLLGGTLIDKCITYQDLSRSVDKFAAALQHLNIAKGDRVAIFLPNCPQFIIAYFAILKIGAIVVPCNPLYVARELDYQLNDSSATAIVALSSFYREVMHVVQTTSLKHVIFTKIKDYYPDSLKFVFTAFLERKYGHHISIRDVPNTYWMQELIAKTSVSGTRVKINPNDTALLMYTGGTTGVPKAAELSHRNMVANAVMADRWVGVNKGALTILTALPLFHSYGMTNCLNFGVYNAGTLILITNPRKSQHILKAIEKHRATIFPGVPTMYASLVNFPNVKKYDLQSLQSCISGASPLPPSVQTQFQQLTGVKLIEGYGLSEASPVTHCNPIKNDRLGTIGVPWPDTEAKIVDVEKGKKKMAIDQVGELVVRGPQVMKGYWNQPVETALTLRKGWLFTGDIACMDDDGYFQILGRKKDLIITGGYNVYPREIEEVLCTNPKVKEVAAIGVPDEQYGEIVKVFVVARENASIQPMEILKFCRERLAKYKIPKAVEFRDELPKTAIGKLMRRALVEEESNESVKPRK